MKTFLVFGEQFRHKSHGLLVISKLLGSSGAFYFSFHAAVHLIWELLSNIWKTDGENIRLQCEVITGLSCELLISLRQQAESPCGNNNSFGLRLGKKMSDVLAPSMLQSSY